MSGQLMMNKRELDNLIKEICQKERERILKIIDSFIKYANEEKKDNYLWYKNQLDNLIQKINFGEKKK